MPPCGGKRGFCVFEAVPLPHIDERPYLSNVGSRNIQLPIYHKPGNPLPLRTSDETSLFTIDSEARGRDKIAECGADVGPISLKVGEADWKPCSIG